MFALMPVQIDIVLHNGNIITMDQSIPRAEALAVSSNHILAIGSNEEIKKISKDAKQNLDLRGRTIIPGFIDTHTHLASLGLKLLRLDLGPATSIENVLEIVRKRVIQTPAGKLVVGYNWDESTWSPPQYLSKTELDPISQQNPVVLFRVCGHLISVNSLALNKLQLDFNQPGVDKDPKTGEPTGILRDIPLDLKGLQPEKDAASKAILGACRHANSLGITSVHENLSQRQLPAIGEYLKLRNQGQLTIRVYANLDAKLLDRLASFGISSGLGDATFRLGGVKTFIDGSFGAQTAALSTPYNDKPDSTGLILMDDEDYRFLLKTTNELGLQVSTHAIGDQGIDLVLRAHEEISGAETVQKLRHNIIHAEFLTKPLMKRVKRLGMLLLQQPNFVHRWGLPGGMYDLRLGPERAQKLNNFRQILDLGIRIGFGSDCMPMNPLYGVFSATTHPNPDTRISNEEALRAYTIDAAFASFEEDIKGSLIPGKLADFVILSQNPLTVPPRDLQKIQVEQTYVGGQLVYSSI